jgi:iron complex outermembrane receptor protein
MRKIPLLLLSLIYTYVSYSQNLQIMGKVIDAEEKTPLSGAAIEINKSSVVITNEKGEFSIPCSSHLNLSVSFLGYETFQASFSCESKILEISLIPIVHSLAEVQITAATGSGKSPLEQPASIVKLEKTELKRTTGIYLDDAINANVPGVFMVRRTQSGGQQLNIRGYGNGMGSRGVNSNFDGQGVKLYLNGIPITDAEGITVMDDIDYGSISHASILKGPSGTMYGLAIAGVVNLQTEKADKNRTSVVQDVMAGSYGLLRTTSRIAIAGENSSLLVSYGHQKFDGFMQHTKSEKDFVNIVGDFRPNKKQLITTYLGYVKSYDERNGELTQAQYDTFDYSGNPRYIKNNAHSAVRSFRAGVGHTYRFNKYLTNSTSFFGSAQSIDNSSAGGWTDKQPVSYGLRSVFEKQFKLSERIGLSGITGIEIQQTNASVIGYGMTTDSTDPAGYNIISTVRSDQATSSSTYSYFTHWTLSLPKQFSVTTGIGLSNMQVRLEDRLWGLSNNHPGNTHRKVFETSYNNLVSPEVAINKKLGRDMSVYSSWTTGYKAPVSSNILIAVTGELNRDLKPERGTQIEIGTKGSVLQNRLNYTLAVFNTRFEDKFTAVTVQDPANTATLYSFLVNGGRLNNKGLEAQVNWKALESKTGFIRLLQPFANFTYSDFRYGNFRFQRVGKNSSNQDISITEDYSGKVVAGVSPEVLNAGVDFYTRAGLYGNLNYNFRSAMFYTSDGLNQTKPFSLLNAKLGFKKNLYRFEIDAFAGVNNITGSQYYYMVFVNQLPDAYIPGPNEVNYYGGINLKFNF